MEIYFFYLLDDEYDYEADGRGKNDFEEYNPFEGMVTGVNSNGAFVLSDTGGQSTLVCFKATFF